MLHVQLATLAASHPANASRPCFLRRKTQFASAARRHVYAVGLEHSGHHLWHDGIFPAVTTASSERLSRALFLADESDPGAAWAPCPDPWSLDRPRLVSELKAAFEADRASADRAGGAWPKPRALRGCSFPCLLARNPDVTLVAEAAEAARADLRIVVMVRDPLELVSSCSEGCGITPARVSMYARACRVLQAQLRSLDPAFLTCFPYSRYPTVTRRQHARVFGQFGNAGEVSAGDGAWARGGRDHDVAFQDGRLPYEAFQRAVSAAWRPGHRDKGMMRLHLNATGLGETAEWRSLLQCAANLPSCREPRGGDARKGPRGRSRKASGRASADHAKSWAPGALFQRMERAVG